MEMECNVMEFLGCTISWDRDRWVYIDYYRKNFHPGREGSVTHRLECEDAIKIAPHSSYMKSATHRWLECEDAIEITPHLSYMECHVGVMDFLGAHPTRYQCYGVTCVRGTDSAVNICGQNK
jgi:hypothetical protein